MTNSNQESENQKTNAEVWLEKQKEEIEKGIDEYRKRVGLPDFSKINNNRVREILSFSITDIKKMTTDEMAESCFILSQYALIIQLFINYEKRSADWAENKLIHLEGIRMNNMVDRFYERGEKSKIIRANDKFGKILTEMKEGCEAKITQLSYIPKHIQSIADRLNEIKMGKLRRHGQDD
ncbi:MAG: hypothetical protein WC967_12095 [Balneolaceae bacterium]